MENILQANFQRIRLKEMEPMFFKINQSIFFNLDIVEDLRKDKCISRVLLNYPMELNSQGIFKIQNLNLKINSNHYFI